MLTEFTFRDKLNDLMNTNIVVMAHSLHNGILKEIGQDYIILEERTINRIININQIIYAFKEN